MFQDIDTQTGIKSVRNRKMLDINRYVKGIKIFQKSQWIKQANSDFNRTQGFRKIPANDYKEINTS